MELFFMERAKLRALPAALSMIQYEDIGIAPVYFPTAIYINRSTWHVLTDHSRKAALSLYAPGVGEDEKIPVLLVEIPADEEIAAAVYYSGGINANLAGKPATKEDDLKLARYAWRLYKSNNRGREILLSMGAEPEYWLDLFDYLAGEAEAEQSPAPATLPKIESEGFDIPMLDPAGQPSRAELNSLEFIAWGTQARNKPIQATHFYTDDARWKGIESKPEALLNAGVKLAIEANYSSRDEMPRALVLGDIYKKRRLALDWIGQGIKVIVDLNMPRSFFAEMLLGVPKTWMVYANRYYADDVKHLHEAYEIAKAHAGEDIIYIVYGTSGAKEICQANNWLFLDGEKSTGWKQGKAFIESWVEGADGAKSSTHS